MLRDWDYAIICRREKAATDIYSFRELRENGFTYVDKTALVLPLCDMSVGKQFFLSRPRRFGKSLLAGIWLIEFKLDRPAEEALALIVPLTMAGVWLAVPGRAWPRALTSLAFPIYLIHYFFVILAVRGGGGSLAASGLTFSLACCAVIAMSVGLSLLFRRLPSPVVSILFGGR